MYYKLDPEVAGHLGRDTAMDPSSHPPVVYSLHYEFDGWPADDLVTSFPCFLVTRQMQKVLEGARPSGCSFADLKASTSEEFEELHPGRPLPSFSWLKVSGVAGRDDFGTTPSGGSLIVSDRILKLMKQGRLDNCDITPV